MSSSSARLPHLSCSRATDADWPDIITTDARAFAMRNPLEDAERDDLRAKVADDDVVLIRDDSHHTRPLVGVSMFYRMTMTVPGGRPIPAAGLSWVSVASTHRRRGILRTMITALFDQWEAENQPVAILTASEGTIYERFGFGPACFADRVSVTPGRPQMRAPLPDETTVRFATPEEIAVTVPELHDRWTATVPGALGRSAAWWRPILADRASERAPSASGLHYLLHADGYASYRVLKNDAGTVAAELNEVVAITDDAHTDLWRVLISLDLIPSLHGAIPVDDPLPVKLTDLRAVTVTGHKDEMWLRILDIPAALGARTYDADLDVVFEVDDPFRGRGGVFDVTVRKGAAIITHSTAKPTVRADISVLSSIYLGGTAPSAFAAAGRLWTDSPTTLRALDRAFATVRAPFAGTFF
ncbi:GNAT family N-acetyltransferase [Gordonia sp. ABSL1-1]|uniref:GNAT family N-acetyltransferase n=1 Tax=Gordonia sp. ABSL1-1 TaxID=3053923 RepID=UPI0025735FDB|nr:GNAT family N-acetyltransferase [Gordonia sp. ABSL1-1]MDL9937771.1 GNAT family N-acetyltransferase [Gordonia sp. ABSL1-1]